MVGSQLRAATAMVAGSVLASVDAVTRPRHARAPLPPRLTITVTPAVERYGWYVDRGAFGADLYVAGRGARLRRRGGRSISAQEHLEAAWSSARDALAGRVGAADLEAADLVVSGGLPLPSEAPVEEALDDRAVGSSSSPFGAVLQERVRPGYRIRAEIATWSFTVFELRSTTTDRRGYVCIPLEWLDDFLEELDDGALDEDLRRFLVLGASGATLSSTEQTSEPGLYDRLGNPRDLLPRERDPITGSFSGGGSGGDRPGKERGRDHRRRPRRFGRILAVAGAAIVVLIVAAVVALAAGGGSDDETAKAAAAPSTSPAPATTRAPSTTRVPAATAPATTTELDPCSVLGDGDVSAAFGLPFTRDQSPDFCSFSRPSGGDFFVEASARRSSSVDGAKRSFEQARQVENVLPGGSNNVQPLAGVGDEAITNTECCGIQGYETTYRVIARKGTTIIELQAEDLGPYGARGLTPGVDPPAALATLANLLLARL